MPESEVIAATSKPATVSSLTAELRSLGVTEGDVVIAHTSMRRLGWIVGGAQAVVAALLAAVGDSGTLVTPAQSGQLSDPAMWSNPPVPPEWVEQIRAEMPLFDPALTPTRGMGQVVECFRNHPDAVRSAHPTLSFVACGPDAPAVVEDHPLTPALGESSPLGRLYELGAKVLLLGVDHGNSTSLHLAEHRAEWSKTVTSEGVAWLEDGVRRWVTYEDLALDDSDFAVLGESFAVTGAERQGPVGACTGRLCDMRSLVDFAVDWMTTHRT